MRCSDAECKTSATIIYITPAVFTSVQLLVMGCFEGKYHARLARVHLRPDGAPVWAPEVTRGQNCTWL